MNDQDEKLSCLLDDHAVDDAEAFTDELIDDVNLQYRLRRYRLMGEAMRRELPASIDTDFHHRVMVGIRQDDSVNERPSEVAVKPAEQGWFAWLKPVTGLAVAISVAVVTVSLWQNAALETGQQDNALATAQQQRIEKLANQQPQAAAVLATSNLPAGTRWKVNQDVPGLQQKLNGYLVNHTEYSNSMQGIIPQARVAGYDAQQ